MRVVVQVPCLNEEETLPAVLSSIPTSIPGVDEVVVVVIDDGSTDGTVRVARAHGVTEIVHHTRNQGLARSFQDGVEHALAIGADIVVNTDGDNQYPQDRIPDLVAPIVAGTADIVIADRQTHTIEHFSPAKKVLQRFGSWIVNKAATTDLPDAASGFRAYSRESLMVLNTITQFSYCMETIIQAGNKRLAIASVPVQTNPKTRESRLFRSTPEHVMKSATAIIRAFLMYRPWVVFVWLGVVFGVLGLVPFVRYAVLWVADNENGHLQSLLAGSVLLIMSCLTWMLAIVADLIRTNRVLIDHTLEHAKRMRFDGPQAAAPFEPVDEPALGRRPVRSVSSAGR